MLPIPAQSLRTTGLEEKKGNRNAQVKFMIKKVSGLPHYLGADTSEADDTAHSGLGLYEGGLKERNRARERNSPVWRRCEPLSESPSVSLPPTPVDAPHWSDPCHAGVWLRREMWPS